MMALAMLQTGELPVTSQPAIVAVAVVYFVIVRDRRLGDAADAHRQRLLRRGGGIGLIALTLAAMSATLSGFAFIGGPGLVYRSGIGAMFLLLPAAVTASMTAWALAKRLRLLHEVRGLITIPDAIGARYRSPAAQGLSATASWWRWSATWRRTSWRWGWW
jgi:Na+/pantothenate symporter